MERFLELNPECIPPPEIDLSLVDYAKICLALLDIPCHKEETIVQSLHCMATLYNNCNTQLEG